MRRWPGMDFDSVRRLTPYQGALLIGALSQEHFSGETVQLTKEQYEELFGPLQMGMGGGA